MLLGEAFQLIGEEACSLGTSADVCKLVQITVPAERFPPIQFPSCRDGKLNLLVGMAERIALTSGALAAGYGEFDR